MASDIAISARGVSKSYRLFDHPGVRVKQFLSLGLKHYHREFAALRDVSFDIRKGETVGIIGRNGSGKSTLLQLICGILKPSAGTLQVNGRISALLELGAGFNPEFTGRENVYFQGALTGLTKAQMDKRFAQIDRIRDTGCTIIFVSHDMGAITSHCDRAPLLDRGQPAMSGPPKPLADRYLAGAIARLPAGDGTTLLTAGDHDPGLAPMSTLVYPQHGAEITSPRILTPEGEVTNLLRRGKEYDYVFDIRFDAAADDIRCGMLIKTPDCRELGGLTSATPGAGLKTALGMRYCQKFRFRCNFLPGTYFINAGVVGPDGSYLHRIIDATMFVVLPESDLCCTGCVDISPARKMQ